jgi:hypothetical protein
MKEQILKDACSNKYNEGTPVRQTISHLYQFVFLN